MQMLAPHLISIALYRRDYFYFTLPFSKHLFSLYYVYQAYRGRYCFSLACFNAKSCSVALMAGKFVTIETRGQSQSNLASSCIESMVPLLTAMKNNLNAVLFINQGNNLVSLAWPFLLSQRDCKWFWKNSLFTS